MIDLYHEGTSAAVFLGTSLVFAGVIERPGTILFEYPDSDTTQIIERPHFVALGPRV